MKSWKWMFVFTYWLVALPLGASEGVSAASKGASIDGSIWHPVLVVLGLSGTERTQQHQLDWWMYYMDLSRLSIFLVGRFQESSGENMDIVMGNLCVYVCINISVCMNWIPDPTVTLCITTQPPPRLYGGVQNITEKVKECIVNVHSIQDMDTQVTWWDLWSHVSTSITTKGHMVSWFHKLSYKTFSPLWIVGIELSRLVIVF